MLQPGTTLTVKVDPADRDTVVLDWQSQAEQAMALSGQAMQGDGRRDAAPRRTRSPGSSASRR